MWRPGFETPEITTKTKTTMLTRNTSTISSRNAIMTQSAQEKLNNLKKANLLYNTDSNGKSYRFYEHRPSEHYTGLGKSGTKTILKKSKSLLVGYFVLR